jgi:1,2-diacylglycerol-3-alpha-glucose alpha-1,2-glucosyltransferase
MKIWLYQGGMKLVSKSGVGKAFEHQKLALEEKGIAFSTRICHDYNIVQLNTIFPDSLLVALVAKIMRKKIVYYAHSTMEDFKKSFRGSNILAPLFKHWLKFCYSMGDIIITPTDYSKNLLNTYGIKKNIISLSNGIDLDFYQRDNDLGKQFREKYHFSETDKIIISVGHYIERKGIEDFVKLAEQMPDYQFIWFGYTNINLIPEKIKKLIQVKLPNLHFPGYVSSEELKQAYCGSDLFLFLTQEETEGIVLLEALAMRIPILIRDIPIYEDWLIDRKQIYKGKKNDEFETLIRDIMEGQVPKLIEEGYMKVKERSISKVGSVLTDVYQNLLISDEYNQENEESNINAAVIMR